MVTSANRMRTMPLLLLLGLQQVLLSKHLFLPVSSFSILPQQRHHGRHQLPIPNPEGITRVLPPRLSTWLLSSIKSTPTTTETTTTTVVVSSPPSSPLPMTRLKIGPLVGSGSYGTVHLAADPMGYICKRAWTQEELIAVGSSRKAERCDYYFQVEQHCFQKMQKQQQQQQQAWSSSIGSSSSSSLYVANYVTTLYEDDDDDDGNNRRNTRKNPWMVFTLLTDKDGNPAPTLEQILDMEWQDQKQWRLMENSHTASQEQQQQQQNHQHHPLSRIQEALGLNPDTTESADTLDIVFQSLLEAIAYIHSLGIVHRDLKPANLLLCPTGKLVLIDFGSAADMDPVPTNIPFQKKRIGLEDDSVAISPIYAAPELFVKPDRAPFAFDVFSAALIFCQVMFNYLDVRTDAAFHQQIQDAQYDLDAWLSRELSSKVRPAGLEEALDYLQQRPGLWKLLTKMFKADPEQRIDSQEALTTLNNILSKSVVTTEDDTHAGQHQDDGPFFESVLRAMDNCDIPQSEIDFVTPRPLHFVASFRRGEPLGLIMSEAGDDVDLEGDKLLKWKEATVDANVGDVFVMDILPGGQADEIGIFEIGDQLQAVGNVPVAHGGFEKVVGMIKDPPTSANYIKLQFDRTSVRRPSERTSPDEVTTNPVRIVDEGAWSSLGRRRANEDFFVLHDIHLDKDVLLAGVFDGHGGKAAAQSASQLMPSLFTEQMARGAITSRQALELAWQSTCDTYRNACDEMGECVAEYDAQDGVLLASTGSEDLIAGTTASVATLRNNELTVLNCGDSRTLLVDTKGEIIFETADHSPETELPRLQRGKEQGLDYSIPECSLSKWWLQCGEIQYAVARSLEGPFATSKGIVSTPDVTSLRPCPGILLIATDGLWEVCGNEEVAKEATRLRQQGLGASEAAKQLSSEAVRKGSTDNVSVVLIYLA